jgi:uncharacterized protein (TIRG00374 family)
MTEEKKSKKPWIKHLGLLLAVVPIVWIYGRLDFHKMLAGLPMVAWWTGPALLLFVLSCMTLQGVRWWILARVFIPGLSLTRALAYHYIGVFYGTAIPSGAAQDVIKTVLLAKNTDVAASWAATWITRILGLPALGILSVYGFFAMDRSTLPKSLNYGMLAFYGLVVLVFFISFSKRLTRPLRRLFEKFTPKKILTVVGDIREGVYRYRGKWRDVAWAFFVTVLTQVLLVCSGIFTLKGISGHFYLWQCFAFIPLIELIAVSFPLTPNGLGIRETLNAGFTAYLGLTKEQLGIYILFQLFFAFTPRLIGLWPVLHGYAKDRRARKAAAAPDGDDSGAHQ